MSSSTIDARESKPHPKRPQTFQPARGVQRPRPSNGQSSNGSQRLPTRSRNRRERTHAHEGTLSHSQPVRRSRHRHHVRRCLRRQRAHRRRPASTSGQAMDRRRRLSARSPSIPPRPARSTPGRQRRRVQEHRRRRHLERGQHRPARRHLRLRARHRSHHARHALRRDVRAAACSRARTAAAPGAPPTRACPATYRQRARHRSHHAQHALRRDVGGGGVFKSTDGGEHLERGQHRPGRHLRRRRARHRSHDARHALRRDGAAACSRARTAAAPGARSTPA